MSEKAMAPYSSTLAWKNPMGGGAWSSVNKVVKQCDILQDIKRSKFQLVYLGDNVDSVPDHYNNANIAINRKEKREQLYETLTIKMIYFILELFSEKAMTPHSSTLTWKIPQTEEPVTTNSYFRRRQWHPTPVLLAEESHGWRSLVAAVHGVVKSRKRLSDFTFTFHFHALEKEMATHSSVLAWRIPECNEVSSNELCNVIVFGVTLGSLYIEAHGYVPMLLENLHGHRVRIQSSVSTALVMVGKSLEAGFWDKARYQHGPDDGSSKQDSEPGKAGFSVLDVPPEGRQIQAVPWDSVGPAQCSGSSPPLDATVESQRGKQGTLNN
ncbi:hypothetical protein MG293_000896 [Ovis ammon polii]|uniref:Uncharacterized protein n=1 Tax=Ovis ammon polii TaxID=230172 RepID=A0AAD4UNQ5_OVIAM|nr:hypothetical protein MG293_000896 [Ovis ammon polii]